MKMNKKGFMLAEVVIVAAVISTVLIFMYISINRMSNAYDTRNRYYDIDAMQVAMEINDTLDNSYDEVEYYIKIPNNNRLINFYNGNNNFNNTVAAYYIKSNMVSITELYDSLEIDAYLKEYIEYLKDNIIFNNYNYLLLVELKDKNISNEELSIGNVHFYTLKVGDANES